MKPGDVQRLEIEKPAAGGPMIARAGGQIVLVTGAIPGEEADVRIDRIGKGVAFGRAVGITRPSRDRREPAGDPECGGCLYAHIAYERQLAIKADVIADAFARIAKMPWTHAIAVTASPDRGYRMRARLHVHNGRWGFYREGTHVLCDARATGQLRADTCDALDELVVNLKQVVLDAEIELSENLDASERAVHIELATPMPGSVDLLSPSRVTGLTTSDRRSLRRRSLAGSSSVRDVLNVDGARVTLRRDVLAFFQGNRYLLSALVNHVAGAVGDAADVVDLYAGVGLFSTALAAKGRRVVAVEGDPVSAADLNRNGEPFATTLTPRAEAVEVFLARRESRPDAVIVDPPRTGMSKEALAGLTRLMSRRLVYVSCDIATLARDTRGLFDAGYQVKDMRAFDLFPNTPHVETVVVFERERGA